MKTFLFAAMVFLSACSVTPPEYTEPTKNEDELARVRTRIHISEGLPPKGGSTGIGLIIAIDGESTVTEITPGKTKILVEPGRHELKIKFIAMEKLSNGYDIVDAVFDFLDVGNYGPFRLFEGMGTLNATFEEGQLYEVRFEQREATVVAQILNKDSGSFVSLSTKFELEFVGISCDYPGQRDDCP